MAEGGRRSTTLITEDIVVLMYCPQSVCQGSHMVHSFRSCFTTAPLAALFSQKLDDIINEVLLLCLRPCNKNRHNSLWKLALSIYFDKYILLLHVQYGLLLAIYMQNKREIVLNHTDNNGAWLHKHKLASTDNMPYVAYPLNLPDFIQGSKKGPHRWWLPLHLLLYIKIFLGLPDEGH